MSTAASTNTHIPGGSFLLEARTPEEIFTPEDFTEQHQLILQTTEEFVRNEIVPNIEKLEHKDFALTRELLKKAGELGLSYVEIPEAYGGLEMDKVTAAIVGERIAQYASFAVTWGGQTGIGMLPIIYFGSEEQKQKYLPRLASGEMAAAYALSEASSGSDALSIRARAELSADGKHYVLNGEKMWITNAGFADLFTVFAKIGDKFTAFLVEKDYPGFAIGAEEHKMGLRGSSTRPIIFNDCQVPVENVLGEIGKGHVIAFNILNIGRFKLCATCLGGARAALEQSIAYAKQRKAFGQTIADFGLIREKFANIAMLIYVGESLMYRTVGMMDAALTEVDKSSAGHANETRKAIEEYAIECSIAKVWGSEMLDVVVDEMVQIYGGYGFVEEYPAERMYRDARVNRIFEGTNEINRLIITTFLLKRGKTGQLPLFPGLERIQQEANSGRFEPAHAEGPLAAEKLLVEQARKLSLYVLGLAAEHFGDKLSDQQEVVGAIAEMVMAEYAMESAVLRTQKMAQHHPGAAALATAMTQVYVSQAMDGIGVAAKKALAAMATGEQLRSRMQLLRSVMEFDPYNTVALRKEIAEKVLEWGKYRVAE